MAKGINPLYTVGKRRGMRRQSCCQEFTERWKNGMLRMISGSQGGEYQLLRDLQNVISQKTVIFNVKDDAELRGH
jgi:hypothetical protein